MRIKTSTLLATAKAIYHAYESDDGEPPIITPTTPFERLSPDTKDRYGRMAKAAAEAINRDYPLKGE